MVTHSEYTYEQWIYELQVTECKGEAGHNSEYVLRLAKFFRY